MEKHTIVVPVDFSESSSQALEYAATFAKQMNSELWIVHAFEPEVVYIEGIPSTKSRKGAEDALHAFTPADPEVPFAHRMLEGSASRAILDFAEESHADMIVMGTHGRTGLTRLLMGSVAEVVVRKARCPVLTLRTPVKAHEEEVAATD